MLGRIYSINYDLGVIWSTVGTFGLVAPGTGGKTTSGLWRSVFALFA